MPPPEEPDRDPPVFSSSGAPGCMAVPEHIVFILGNGSMLIVIQHFKEVTHEKDIKRDPV
jgi:hypothetical protein